MFTSKRPEMPKEKLSTKWHNMKQRFKYLFAQEHHLHIEQWYNQVATHKQRDMFREVIKCLHQHEDTELGQDAVQSYRAGHMMTMYHVLLTQEGRAKTKSWLSRATAQQLDKFREVFAAVQATLQPESATKAQFQYRPPHDAVQRDAFRKKIDWESSKTAENVRKTAKNPMDTHSHLPTADVGGTGKTTKRVDRGTAAANSIMKILKVDEADLAKMKDERAQELDNFYEVDPQGVTVFKTKQAAKASKLNVNLRVIPTFGGTEWKTTNRDLHKNLGVHKPERVVAEEHPAIAQTTASLGFCLPTLSPQRKK